MAGPDMFVLSIFGLVLAGVAIGFTNAWWTGRPEYKADYYLIQGSKKGGGTELYRVDHEQEARKLYAEMSKKYDRVTLVYKARKGTIKVQLAMVEKGAEQQ